MTIVELSGDDLWGPRAYAKLLPLLRKQVRVRWWGPDSLSPQIDKIGCLLGFDPESEMVKIRLNEEVMTNSDFWWLQVPTDITHMSVNLCTEQDPAVINYIGDWKEVIPQFARNLHWKDYNVNIVIANASKILPVLNVGVMKAQSRNGDRLLRMNGKAVSYKKL